MRGLGDLGQRRERGPAGRPGCPDYDTGNLSANDQTSYTIQAPEGQVIVAVCVKAGSAKQGLGAEITPYDPGVTSVTIQHSSGKEISHYSVLYDDKKVPPPCTDPKICPDPK